ncbi:MAG: cell wall-binding repeat-containing protein [Actinobacteria bacterium]|nr:cell wall-binding repeat-containing protein [Actinomycetota bacterium]
MIGHRPRRPGVRGVLHRITRPFVFLVLLLTLVGGSELSAAIATEFLSAQEAELGRLLNAERTARGLPGLANSAALRTVARRHAQRMMTEGTIFHNERLREDVEAVFPAWASIGENVGYGPSVPRVHEAFLASPAHRANILDPDWGWVGIGVVSGGSRLFMTQNFLALQSGAPRPAPAQFRLSGASRTATARSLADFGFTPGSAAGAVVADAFDFHGALAGAALAGQLGGPIVLTGREGMDADALAAIVRALGTARGKTVHLVGGPFDPSVRAAVEATGATVRAIGGGDHVRTAADAARQLPRRPTSAFLTTVDDYPDALAASALAARTGTPVLYTGRDALSPDTAAVIRELGIGRVDIVGGEGAVGTGVERALRDAGVTVRRIAGPSRVETALAVADHGLGLGLGPDHILLATASNFPDALAGGALSSQLRSPVLLTSGDRLHPAVASWLRNRRGSVDAVYLLGGTAALAGRIEQDVDAALR